MAGLLPGEELERTTFGLISLLGHWLGLAATCDSRILIALLVLAACALPGREVRGGIRPT